MPQTSVSLGCLKLFRISNFIFGNAVSVRAGHACSLYLTLMELNEWPSQPQAERGTLPVSPSMSDRLCSSVSIQSQGVFHPRKGRNTTVFFYDQETSLYYPWINYRMLFMLDRLNRHLFSTNIQLHTNRTFSVCFEKQNTMCWDFTMF